MPNLRIFNYGVEGDSHGMASVSLDRLGAGWCSMESFGNRTKARRHYQRQQQGDEMA